MKSTRDNTTVPNYVSAFLPGNDKPSAAPLVSQSVRDKASVAASPFAAVLVAASVTASITASVASSERNPIQMCSV